MCTVVSDSSASSTAYPEKEAESSRKNRNRIFKKIHVITPPSYSGIDVQPAQIVGPALIFYLTPFQPVTNIPRIT
jgi:hypothetical protein